MTSGRLAKHIGQLLRVEREKARMSQAALASAAGTAQQGVSRLETGRYSPTTAVVERLFAALGFQVRVELESLDAEVDAVIAAAGTDDDAEAIEFALADLASLRRWAGELPYHLDGVLAARLHGVPMPVTGELCLAVAEAQLDRLAEWILAVPNCRRYDERLRQFAGFDVDPTRPGPLR